MAKNTCDEKVFDRIFRELASDLNRFLHHKFGASYNPADMIQEAFMALWNNCHKVSPDKAKSYLFTVANNMTLKSIDKGKSAEKYISRQELNPVSEDPQQSLEGKEFSEKLNSALNDMPETQRVAFMLNKVEGKKHREIAEMLGISQKAVEKRIYKAAEFLFERIGKKI